MIWFASCTLASATPFLPEEAKLSLHALHMYIGGGCDCALQNAVLVHGGGRGSRCPRPSTAPGSGETMTLPPQVLKETGFGGSWRDARKAGPLPSLMLLFCLFSGGVDGLGSISAQTIKNANKKFACFGPQPPHHIFRGGGFTSLDMSPCWVRMGP